MPRRMAASAVRRRLCLVASAAAVTLTAASGSASAATGWEVLVTPNLGTGPNELNAISGVAPDDVWAVGDYDVKPSAPKYPQAMHYNGTSWQSVTVPRPSQAQYDYDELTAVDAISSDDVWAVGYDESSNSLDQITLADHWNGSSWQTIPTPNPSPFGLQSFTGVAAASPTDVYAVGESWDNGGQTSALVERWDGSAWSVVPVPASLDGISSLFGVAVRSATQIWAVGYRFDSGVPAPLVMRYDGSKWTIMTTPDPGEGGSYLTSIALLPNGSAFASGTSIGYSFDGDQITSGFGVELVNGSWQDSDQTFTGQNTYLAAVVTDTAGDVWLAGYGSDQEGAFGHVLYRAAGKTTWRFFAGAEPGTYPGVNGAAYIGGRLWLAGSVNPSSSPDLPQTYVERSQLFS